MVDPYVNKRIEVEAQAIKAKRIEGCDATIRALSGLSRAAMELTLRIDGEEFTIPIVDGKQGAAVEALRRGRVRLIIELPEGE